MQQFKPIKDNEKYYFDEYNLRLWLENDFQAAIFNPLGVGSRYFRVHRMRKERYFYCSPIELKQIIYETLSEHFDLGIEHLVDHKAKASDFV